MAQMNVSLPDKLKEWAESRVNEGGYSSTSDYVRDLVRRDQEYERRRAWLRVELQKGLDSGVSTRSLQDIFDDVRKKRAAA